jgi:hypothetical protein
MRIQPNTQERIHSVYAGLEFVPKRNGHVVCQQALGGWLGTDKDILGESETRLISDFCDIQQVLQNIHIMQLKYTLLLATGLLAGSAIAYTAVHPDRRAMLKQSAAAMAFVLPTTTARAAEADGDADGFMTTDSGLRYKVITEGTGAIPQTGQTVKAHYTGMEPPSNHRTYGSLVESAAHSLTYHYTVVSVRLVGWF